MASKRAAMIFKRCMSSVPGGKPLPVRKPLPYRRVTVLGAAGGIGQPLSMLLKLNPLVSKLSLYDIAGTPGVATDLSHINTRTEVHGFAGDDQLKDALKDADLVIIPAGVPRKPGMTRDELFDINAGIVKKLVQAIAKHCPFALINMISNPVNSTVPIAAEVLKVEGTYDHTRLFGVTTLDVVRARTFYAKAKNLPIEDVDVPVVGGHAGKTILPLFSQATPQVPLSKEEVEELTRKTQDGGTEVVQAKAGKGSATLSMAYAAALFAESCLKAMNGEPNIIGCAYVGSSVTDYPFFASKVELGKHGMVKALELGPISKYEQTCLDEMKDELMGSIDKGVAYVHNTESEKIIESLK
ncbi:malate dehydrogenase, mitochondrial [Selaginella moellendorffii]|nr:malate dehydrogenase, mitochondrial [Selaginella moellendorffii]|eukprot:XP_002976052.2 malate dehydrogenase, mitochondrial [Selaginella moellendorffii]